MSPQAAPDHAFGVGERQYGLCRHCGRRIMRQRQRVGDPWGSWWHVAGRRGLECMRTHVLTGLPIAQVTS